MTASLTTTDQNDASMGTTKRLMFRHRAPTVMLYTLLCLAATIFAFPIVWLIINSLKLNSEIGTIPFQFLPRRPIWSNYIESVTRFPFLPALGNSLLTAMLSTVPTVISSSLAGFGFARYRAPGRDVLFMMMLATILIPNLITAIPQFMIYARLGMINTYWPWFIGGIGGAPFFIFLFRQFFAGIPRELEEAAELDGCNRFQIYSRIFLPNATPVLATTFIFSFLGNWSDFISPKLFLSENQATLAAKLASAYTDPKGNPLEAQTMAAIVLYVLPLVFVYLIGQRYIYQISLHSGIK